MAVAMSKSTQVLKARRWVAHHYLFFGLAFLLVLDVIAACLLMTMLHVAMLPSHAVLSPYP